MSEKGALQAVFEGRCPKCRQGKMFASSTYDIKKLGTMNKNCPHCGHQFEMEPGYFYGAMYVSYALSVGIFLATTLILFLLFDDPSLTTYIVSITLVALLLYPINLRYSRILFAHFFGGVNYDPELSK
ncbi:MAG: DUF983 domain-containing protein [Marinoscillum sp.]